MLFSCSDFEFSKNYIATSWRYRVSTWATWCNGDKKSLQRRFVSTEASTTSEIASKTGHITAAANLACVPRY